MNTNKKTPKLRFKGFTDDWEQRKLGDLAEIVRGASPRPISDSKWFDNNSDVGWLRISDVTAQDGRIQYLEQKISKLGQDKTRVVKTPHLLLSIAATVGKPVINYVPTGVHDGFLIFLNPKFNILYAFWWLEIFREEWNKYGQPGSQVNLNSDLVKNQVINIPNEKEQEKISSFLEALDRIITLHQRKLEKLKLNKSALLQKLFPQKGCTIPDVRFKGFTDAWEQRKLNDFGIATGGTSIESEFVDGGTYKVINIGSYSEESVYNDQGLRVNKTDKTKSRILNKYDLTMILNDKTASGNIIGRVLLIDQDNTYVYNQRTERIEVDTKNFLPMFLYHMLNAPEQRKYIVKASQGNTQIYVNWSTISNIDYMIPQLLLEQEKIANLFSLINKDITLHQRKLDCLISIKKGLLQQLFV